MRAARDPQIGAVVEGMAPALDIFLNGSTDVNLGRAEQSGSVATPPAATEAPPATSEVRLLSPAEVATLVERMPSNPKPPDVDFSLFVQLSQDLDPDARREAVEAVKSLTRRARWKQDTAAVEVAGANVDALRKLRAVSYVEPGQTLRGPERGRGRRPLGARR